MTESPQPTAGSLSAKIIRACKDHGNTCKLDCPRRQVEDLGQIASFDVSEEEEERRDPARDPSIMTRLKAAYYQWHGGQKS